MMLTDTVLVGFDSAWADNPRIPGAICALIFNDAGTARFEEPRLVGFEAAAEFIAACRKIDSRLVVAIDQPTIVVNVGKSRPCERVVASVISWVGGGIQPANREGVGKAALFGDGAPIWVFLERIGASLDPEQARTSTDCVALEVFPALALLDFDEGFVGRKLGPRYNPTRPTFKLEDWSRVLAATARQADHLNLPDVARWCRALDATRKPRKADQDRLDAIICVLIAALWLQEPHRCVMVGDTTDGYIIAPASGIVRERLSAAAERHAVPLRSG